MPYPVVIIPTLCRDKHLKRCLDSLARCTHAEEVDVIIGLDYPAKESHRAGYQRICEYLPTVKGFHSFEVRKREKNFGSRKNTNDLLYVAAQAHDAYIYMDDDCQVSPNFFDYIYKGMERFKDDPSVFAICGYSFLDKAPHESNSFYRQNDGICVWGYCIPFANLTEYNNNFTRGYCVRKLLNPITFLRGACHSWSTILFLILRALKSDFHTDNTYSIYMFYEHKDVIMPVVSLVRNNGFDGSGEHCEKDESYKQRRISSDTTFDFVGTGMECRKEIHKILLDGKRKYITFSRMCKTLFKMTTARLKRK